MSKAPPLSADTIQARLNELEVERTALYSLLKIYGGGAPRQNGTAPSRPASKSFSTHASGAAASSANGTTPAIMEAVKRHPGINKERIVEYVLSKITPTAADPKSNIRTIIRYQVRQGKIEQRGEGFYLAQN